MNAGKRRLILLVYDKRNKQNFDMFDLTFRFEYCHCKYF